jgi:hypothetical protein
VFWISAAIMIFDAVEFLIFGDGKEQPWNNLAAADAVGDGSKVVCYSANATEAGVVGAGVTNPLDVLKNEQQDPLSGTTGTDTSSSAIFGRIKTEKNNDAVVIELATMANK